MKKKEFLVLVGILGCLWGGVSNTLIIAADSEDTVTSNSEKDDNIIDFDSACTVIDDENLKMQVESVQKEIFNEGKGQLEYITYSINLNIENKNKDHDIDCSVSTESCYIDGYTVVFANDNTKTKAGKKNDTAKYTCTVYPNNEQSSSQGSEHIKSVEDLLTFEAAVNVMLYDNTGDAQMIVDRYVADISLDEAVTADSSAQQEKAEDSSKNEENVKSKK